MIAYAVFEILMHQNPKLDLYGILRLPTDEYIFPENLVEDVVEQMQEILFKMEKEERLSSKEKE